jgi:hypothetical protein
MFEQNTHTLSALNTLCNFNVPEHVPFDKGIGFEELATKCGLEQDILTRFIRMVETSYIFKEERFGIVSHTAVSKLLATEEAVKVRYILTILHPLLIPSWLL